MAGWVVRIVTLAMATLSGMAAGAAHAGAPAQGGFGDYRPVQSYAEQVVTSFYLPMRDGVKIAVSLHRPAKDGRAIEGRFPVVWHHTLDIQGPGARGGPVGPETRDLTTLTYNGYVVAVVARRGAGASFGVRRGYQDLTEAYDGYEVNEWLAAQPWSTGAVGMYGCSNTGEAVMHVVTVRPPHLKAAFAGCFSWDRYDGFARGGLLANWGTGPSRTLEEDMQAVPVQGDESRTLLRQAAEEHQGSTPLLELMQGMPYRDSFSRLVMSRFWAEASPSSYLDQIRQADVPLYIQAGWYDDFRSQGLIAFANMKPGRRWIVIGPWLHCANTGFDLRSEQLRFFDYWLKGIDTGIVRDDPIRYFTINAPAGREWRSAKAWPVSGTQSRRYFLGRGGRLVSSPTAESSSFAVDDKPECPGVALSLANITTVQPCHPLRGAVSYAAEAFSADTEVTGHVTAGLWVSSSEPDANLFAYLEDVAADGSVQAIADARQRLSLRKVSSPRWDNLGLPWRRSYAEDAAPLAPGEPVELQIEFLPVSYVFKAGHRLQVTIAGADYRKRVRAASATSPILTIHSDPQRPSSILVPERS